MGHFLYLAVIFFWDAQKMGFIQQQTQCLKIDHCRHFPNQFKSP